jgi:hypothetical protein
MSKLIHERITKYINHKIEILIERVYLAILDKIFDAENYDQFEIDTENNIYITYSLKKDENILSDAHDFVTEQVKKKYRKKLLERLEEEGYFVEFDDSDINVFFEKPLKIENNSDVSSIEHHNEQNILHYKKSATYMTKSEDSGIFDFNGGDD